MPRATRPDWPIGLPLTLDHVTAIRGGRAVLDRVTLTFEPGLSYVLIGPSGAGKSTLLRLLNRLDDPDSGTLRIGDDSIASLPIAAVRRGIGLVFQNPRALPGRLRDNLAFPSLARGAAAPADDALAAGLAEVGLDPASLDRETTGLSGGERQRLAVATALAAGPEILGLDEPTSGLDPTAARRLADLLDRRRRRDGLRPIAVTHHREHAAWLGERAVWLEAGRVVEVGPTAEVIARCDARAWADAPSSTSP